MNKVYSIAKVLAKTRLNADYHRLVRKVYTKVGTLSAEYSPSAEPVMFEDRLNLEYRSIKVGEIWDRQEYGCGWFRFKGEVPASAKGKKVALLLSIGGEGCVYTDNGTPKSGITEINAFVEYQQPCVGKRYYDFTDCAEGGEKIDIWMDCGNNHMPPDPRRIARFKQADIVVVDEKAKSAFYDATALLYQWSLLKPGDEKRASISSSVRQILSLASKGDYDGAKEAYKAECERGEESPYTVYATGHAHLDLAWLWPMRETKRKAERTFSNQLRNMDRYPEYVFGASQPQQFAWMEERYPELFEELRSAVERGQLELQGGMWVECDTNVTSGESLIRQNLYGKRYWKEKFGKDMRMCWLPDVFGFSGNLPQIIKKCGMDYFETIKLSWNEHNKFPHRLFIWEGIDDSEVIVHMPPDETYTSEGFAWSLMHALDNYPEKDRVKTFGLLYGMGDGGGGPGEGHIEAVRHERELKGLPKVEMRPAIDCFDKLAESKDVLVRHKGELYLEKHQGTYTTQSRNKYYNRRIEFALHNVEFLASVAEPKGYVYPKERIEAIWKEILLYQFHDIIPGSSINRVYKESVERYEILFKELKEIRNDIVKFLATGESQEPTAINFTSAEHKGLVSYKDKWYVADVAPYSSKKLVPFVAPAKTPLSYGEDYIESDLYRVAFDANGNIVSLLDKRSGKDFCGKYLNKLNVYNDKRLHYNAWDIDINYTKTMPAEFKLIGSETTINEGSVTRENTYKYKSSRLTQKVVLTIGKPLVEFVTMVDWHETHKMLRADFRPSVFADEVTCDIQMGNLKRSTHDDTKIEKAQFEICAHKWIDVTAKDVGLSVLTHEKYGWRVKEGLISLNLLRSPVYPDPTADRGSHIIKYALYPHAGDYNEAETQSLAYLYNNPLHIVDECVDLVPQFVSSDTHIVVETVKPAESGEGVVVRLYEDSGAPRTVTLTTPVAGTAYETDMLENIIGDIDLNALTFKPFEIKTILIK